MYRSKKLLALPVISLSDGEELGKVKGIIIDSETISLAALVLDYRKGFLKEPRLIHFDQITSFGDYAITIKNPSACERIGSRPQLNPLVRQPVQILGAKVLSEDGNLLGTVEEFTFEPTTGKISSLELTDNLLSTLFKGKSYLDGNTITALGKSTIIVQKGAQLVLAKEDKAITDVAKSVKETSQKVWGQTKETTKKIGESIYKSVEKFTSEEADDGKTDAAVNKADKKLPEEEPTDDKAPPPKTKDIIDENKLA